MRVTRFSAFLIHLGISIAIFLVLLAIVVFVWFRAPLFSIDGGWDGIKIIAGVDLVLGPLLTLIVYKPGKPRLKLDLTIIGLIQTVALISGTWIVHAQRPVMLILAETHFYCMSADYIGLTGLNIRDVEKYDDRPYPIAVITLPDDEDARQKVRLQSLARGGMHLRGDLFAPRNAQYMADVKRYSIDMGALTAADEKSKVILNRFTQTHGPVSDFYFIPIYGRRGRAILALDPVHGDIVEKLDIQPPKP